MSIKNTPAKKIQDLKTCLGFNSYYYFFQIQKDDNGFQCIFSLGSKNLF